MNLRNRTILIGSIMNVVFALRVCTRESVLVGKCEGFRRNSLIYWSAIPKVRTQEITRHNQ